MPHTPIEYICSGCCGLMAEMGNLLGMSYQKINVILFVFSEPILTATMVLALLFVLFKLPARLTVWKVAKYTMYAVGTVTLLLLIAAAIKICIDWKLILDNPMSLLHLDEPSLWIRQTFRNTVSWLVKWNTALGISYSAINVLLYIVAMPSVIITCYIFCKIQQSKKGI